MTEFFWLLLWLYLFMGLILGLTTCLIDKQKLGCGLSIVILVVMILLWLPLIPATSLALFIDRRNAGK